MTALPKYKRSWQVVTCQVAIEVPLLDRSHQETFFFLVPPQYNLPELQKDRTFDFLEFIDTLNLPKGSLFSWDFGLTWKEPKFQRGNAYEDKSWCHFCLRLTKEHECGDYTCSVCQKNYGARPGKDLGPDSITELLALSGEQS